MRKKIFTFLLALAASVGLMNAAVDDSGSCGANVTYSFNGTTGEMVISGTGPMTVFSSGTAPWKNYKDAITSVVVEDGVTSVSQYSFGQCTNLTTVVIGNDVETIGQFAFNDCGTSFTSLTLGSSLKSVGMAAFLNAKGITTLTLPDGFETVGDYAFCRLEALQTLNIPSSVTSIGTSAFYRCYPLATINCAAVTPPSLGDDAFGDIANKSSIPLNVPNGSVAAYTAAAQWNAFNIHGYDPAPAPANVCGDGLTWELSEGVLTISYDGVGTGEMYDFGYEYDENPVNVAPWKENKSAITTVIVGDGVKSIGNYAFNDLYENFTAVTIANSVERIGVFAFTNAKWITEITLPSSLKTIDEQCFGANFGITSITIPSGVTSIGYKAFCYCNGLTSLTCEATTPPTLASSVFYKIRSKTSDISNIPLYVPSGSVTAYEAAAQWNTFDIHGYDPAPGGGSEPATGLQVVEVTSDIYDGWNSNSNPFSVNALPGFQAVTFDEAKEWTGVPTSGTAVLVYRTNGDNARVIQFFDGTIMDDYDIETDFNQIYENITISGNRIFYTAGGGSTPDPAPTPSVNAARFVYNYDCQRNPPFPKVNNACNLSGFKDPYEGYKGYRNGNIAVGPWKLEFVAYYTPSNNYGCSYIVSNAVNQYFMTLSNEEKEAKKLEVPIFRLWQYNLTEREYQHATYGIVCAYAGEANAQDHAALFISTNNMGCFLTGHQHTTSFALTCENDLTTGLADLVAAASASDPELDAIQPILVSIDAIGTVKLSDYCKFLIEGSRAAYNALTDEQKAQITNYNTLVDAESQWAALVTESQPYANAVIDLINAIPNPVVYTQECKDAIDAAQAAYEALTDNQKYLVTNTETLLQAPTAFVSAAPYVNIIFTADNSNVKRIENVTLPKEFTSGDYSSEIVAIIKELYDIDKEYMMYWYNSSDRNAVETTNTTWTVNPFVGAVRVNGALRDAMYTPQSFVVDITLELPPFGPAPQPTTEKVITNEDPENPNYHYSTFFHSTQNYKLTNDGTQAFIATLSNNDLVLTKIAEGTQVIPANTAVIFRKSGSADPVVLTPTEENGVSVNPDDNSLKGVDDATPIASIDGLTQENCYVLSGTNEYGVGFYRILGNTLKAHKAYVIYSGNAAPRRMRFVFNQEQVVTGIDNANADTKAEKRIENGQLIIIKNGVRYNAQGQLIK